MKEEAELVSRELAIDATKLGGVGLNDPKFAFMYEDILRDFEINMPREILQKKYNINDQTFMYWKSHWLAILDFGDAAEPPFVTNLKRIAKGAITKRALYKLAVGKSAAQIIMEEKRLKKEKQMSLNQELAGINDLRLRGLRIVNLGMDRVEELIVKEKSIGQIAKVLSAVMPYVLTRVGEESKIKKGSESLEERREKFVQNIMNIYNMNSGNTPDNQIKIEDNDTEEDNESEWYPEEQSSGDLDSER